MSLRVWLAAGAALLMLAGCASGPVRRVSEPAVGIQQLTVGADGGWTLELRINNFSSIPMRFDALDLKLSVAGQDAGTEFVDAGFDEADLTPDLSRELKRVESAREPSPTE